MTHQPFKCPDCGLWWRTETHRCSDYPPNKGLSPTPTPKSPPKIPAKINVDHLDLCVVCERVYDTRANHHCNKSIQYEKNKKPQFEPEDKRHHPVYDKWRNES